MTRHCPAALAPLPLCLDAPLRRLVSPEDDEEPWGDEDEDEEEDDENEDDEDEEPEWIV